MPEMKKIGVLCHFANKFIFVIILVIKVTRTRQPPCQLQRRTLIPSLCYHGVSINLESFIV